MQDISNVKCDRVGQQRVEENVQGQMLDFWGKAMASVIKKSFWVSQKVI